MEGELELAHARLLDALRCALQPVHAVLDLDLLVLELIEVVDAHLAPEVEVRPDRVADVFALEVDHHVMHLPVGGELDRLAPQLLVILMQVEQHDRHRGLRVDRVHLLDARPEGEVQQRLLARTRHVPWQQHLRERGHLPRLVHLDV